MFLILEVGLFLQCSLRLNFDICNRSRQGAKETGRRQEMKQESCFIGLVVGALTNAVNISTVNPK